MTPETKENIQLCQTCSTDKLTLVNMRDHVIPALGKKAQELTDLIKLNPQCSGLRSDLKKIEDAIKTFERRQKVTDTQLELF